MSNYEKNKFKICDNKKSITNKSKYLSWVSLWEIYNIYIKDGRKGLINYKKKLIEKCNPLIYNFYKLNLINNKHIPQIYLETSIENRKKLLVEGIILQSDINKVSKK